MEDNKVQRLSNDCSHLHKIVNNFLSHGKFMMAYIDHENNYKYIQGEMQMMEFLSIKAFLDIQVLALGLSNEDLIIPEDI